jgi:cation:H+ antiporter
MLFLWILIFVLSLALLVKSADWLVSSSEKIALAFKISPFIIGVTLVALGTSFPELATSLIATFKGNTEVVVDTAFGSNIATILLIVGIAAITGRKLVVKRSLIDLDAPLLAVSTALVAFMVWDRQVVLWEGIVLMSAFVIYVLYTISQRRSGVEETPEAEEVLPSRVERRENRLKIIGRESKKQKKAGRTKLDFKIFLFFILGTIGLVVGANYAIESMVKIAEFLKISSSLIAITALAVGTSLPELVVSVRAALKKKYALALGNVFGSNVFTIFLIIGLPALFRPLAVNESTLSIGLPYLIVATLLFVISGISRRIHIWEGAMYILIYVLFVLQLCGLV